MKILSWNVRGSGNKEKRRAIKETICKVNPDIIVLQEVKKGIIERRFIGSIWRSRFKAWIFQPAIGRSGGTLVAWDTRSVSVTDSLVGEFTVSIRIEAGGKTPWWFSGVYGPVVYGNRDSFWDELAGLSVICGTYWCLGGDFNVVRRGDEKLNSATITRSMKNFDALIREMNLVDPKLHNGRFTWTNFRQRPICCRLDRFLFSPTWTESYPFIRQEVLVRIVSDHCPIVLDSNPPSWGPSPFRFDNSWLEHKDFKALCQKWWNSFPLLGWPGYGFMEKLSSVKDKVKGWSKEVFRERSLIKQSLEKRMFEFDRLEEGGQWNEQLLLERRKIKKEWQQVVFEEERGVWFKSKCEWAKQGDSNSKLFHSILSARKARNFISRIELEDGAVLDKDGDIEKAIVDFFFQVVLFGR
ncbi:uncharacterized protein LOC133799309 [Humulus lupulus]|uniref:uncharacterized protein LOC133799309 n=1 Tax=Humulus lupulus TaxID=3486 RepID=UPI002B40AC8B|nr:uncharacterized protein LOC133799309 [Humulus lupulus]